METATISPSLLRMSMELTGEPRPETALVIALKDALMYRFEQIKKGLKIYEKRYRMNFIEFKKAWNEDRIDDKYSYKVEKDLWEWEALVSREKKLRELEQWLI